VRLLLARHGATAATLGVAIGRTDVELAPAGRRQAELLAERLAACPLERVYSSDLRRALETASIVAERRGLPVEATPELRELDFGAWEGRQLADLWRESPAEARAWESDLRRLPPSFGETIDSLESRVARFAGRLETVSGDVLVVAHRGSLAMLYALLARSTLDTAWRIPFDLGSLTELEVGGILPPPEPGGGKVGGAVGRTPLPASPRGAGGGQ
jgi:alpha-ribazole phosphatase